MADNANNIDKNFVGKKLTDLKVVELRSELDKRRLDKTGVKAVLFERLQKALENEGKTPNDYLFSDNELQSRKSSSDSFTQSEIGKDIKDEEEDEEVKKSEIIKEVYKDPNDISKVKMDLESIEEKCSKIVDNEHIDDDDSDKTEEGEQSIIDEEDKNIMVEKQTSLETNDNNDVTCLNEGKEEDKDNLLMTTNQEIKSDDMDVDVSTAPSSAPPPPPAQSSSSDANAKDEEKTKVEDEKMKKAEESTTANTEEDQSSTAATADNNNDDDDDEKNSLNEAKEDGGEGRGEKEEDYLEEEEGEEGDNAMIMCDILPPTPTSVPCVAPLTSKDTISMDTSTAQQSEENESLIVHVDDTQNDLDADLLNSQTNGLKLKQTSKEKLVGKGEGKKSDVASGGISNDDGCAGPPGEVPKGAGGAGENSEEGVKIGEVGEAVGGGKVQTEVTKSTEKKEKNEKKDDKEVKLKSATISRFKFIRNVEGGGANGRNLWVSGLSSNTQATDLKGLFSKYGKVVGTKVVTNACSPGAKCFGFITMATSEEASKCVQHLNQTELHGKMISVKKSKNEPAAQNTKKAGGENKTGGEKTDVKKDNSKAGNIWVSGLSSNTRATDLKGLFSKYGKVVGAKLVTNARSPGARCYGFLTMSSPDEASKCIQHLNQTELHGKMISVERAKNEPGGLSAKKTEGKTNEKKSEKPEAKKEEKKGERKDDKDRKSLSRRDSRRHSSSHQRISDKSRVVVMDRSKGEPVISVKRSKENAGNATDKTKTTSSSSSTNKESKTSPSQKSTKESGSASASSGTTSGKDKTQESKKDVLSFDRIRAEREKERLRQSERRLRDEERHRLQELDRARLIQRHIQKKQKEEAIRLKRVKERLRLEREKLETEKLERERIKVERALLERERVRDEQRKIELLRAEEQQRRALKRSYERGNVQHNEGYWNEPKRQNLNNAVPPPPPPTSNRFELRTFSEEPRYNLNVDYGRRVGRYERHESGSRFEERKDRDLSRRQLGPVRDWDDRRPDERNHQDNRFDRRDVGPGRDRSNDHNHETDRKDMGMDRGGGVDRRDSDRRNISAHDRLGGRVRNSAAVPPPDNRVPWGSGAERKVDNWPQPHHGNINNSGSGVGVNHHRGNDRWINNNNNNNNMGLGAGANTGGFGGGPSGMVQNMGHGNTFVNPQNQPGGMMGGGGVGGVSGSAGNMGGRMQEPRFDAYELMRRY